MVVVNKFSVVMTWHHSLIIFSIICYIDAIVFIYGLTLLILVYMVDVYYFTFMFLPKVTYTVIKKRFSG